MPNKIADDTAAAVLVLLIERIALRDDKALRSLYVLKSRSLLTVALRISRRSEFAEEALQESFVNIWRYASEYKNSMSPPLVWMRAIVRNRTLDYMRRRQSIAGPEIEWNDILDDVLAADMADPYDLAVSGQRTSHLAICMNSLGANQRRALELAYFYDLSHREVAQEMHAPLGTVKAWIRRALETLRISLTVLDPTTSLAASWQTGNRVFQIPAPQLKKAHSRE
ncbi:RNA polymerase sigma factor [Caballeronia sordidicola]|uniref:RNA polymerase sigma factor n=1 Tax=Caballeronia sordidicola TaxID=196367 RepID=UPI000A36E580|nr:sigma-70 family RNA polymerase sigma factor [Caballeronia sordidicola]